MTDPLHRAKDLEGAFIDLLSAHRARKDAEQQYVNAIAKAVRLEMSNVKIARILGISETAIRRYRKRHSIV